MKIHEEIYKGVDIEIHTDDRHESPREWCNLGTIATWHKRYTLGDIQPKDSPEEFLKTLACNIDPELEELYERLLIVDNYLYDGHGWFQGKPFPKYRHGHLLGNAERMVERRRDKALENYIILPVYMYDHSGIVLSTRGFSCSWDSGQLGIIYCTMDDARKLFTMRSDDEVQAAAETMLRSEVDTYSKYLDGDVYGFLAGDDSCWGFYDFDECLAEAKASVDTNPAATDYYDYRILNHFLPALINDDFTGLTKEEESQYLSWANDCYRNAKADGWKDMHWAVDCDAGFSRCEITNLHGDCTDVRLIVMNRKVENKNQTKMEV